MAGPIQKAMSDVVGTVSAIATVGKKLSESEKQARQAIRRSPAILCRH